MSPRSPKLTDLILWIGGAAALVVLGWLFLTVANRPAPQPTSQSVVLVTSTPTLEATPTVESVWHFIVTPTPGGTLYLQPTLPPPPPVIYPPPRARSGFLFGGQVQDFKAPDKMQWAGMKWVKFQINEGDSDAVDKIKRGHDQGFKVLLTVIGAPSRVTDESYYAQYAAYVGSLAANGADAVEIWNEPNIARDWPAGQISPVLYIKFLKPSYEAIKATNPVTLVISAAQAATLVGQSLRTPNFWTEVDYTTDFVLSAGLLYTDCVGVHYNVGTTSPDTTDPNLKGDAAFVYLPRLLEYYASLTRGTRPVCITELGYLTDDGYDPLSQVAPDFNWAQNTTVQDQAKWHAHAASIGAGSPLVEMIIVWNVDFWAYGADPHAGYAIIRPGGGCPACDALHVLGLGE